MPPSPKVDINRAGVPTMLPPNRCCWIIVSSKGPQARPLMNPPQNAAPTFSPSPSGRLRLLSEAGFSGYFLVEVIHRPGSAHDADAVSAQYAEQFQAIVANF
mgnify:CR=1 FL=1